MATELHPDLLQPLARQSPQGRARERRSIGYWQDAWRRFRKNRLALSGLVILTLIVAVALIGPEVWKYDYRTQDLSDNYAAPSLAHPLGTDLHGRDMLARVLLGGRISLAVGLFTALISVAIGAMYGAFSGYAGGIVDQVLMRIVDVLYGLPFLLYVILLMVVLGSGLQNVFIALGLVYWIQMARIVRGEVLSLREREFILAARTMGVGRSGVILRHVIPNVMGPVIVTATLMIPDAIFTEAFLSFIGLGVPAPLPSWGALANEGYQAIRVAPWTLIAPGAAISLTILAFQFVGDGLRDALDPRLRR